MKQKNIKVAYTSRSCGNSYTQVPKIQMEGKWLEELGFEVEWQSCHSLRQNTDAGIHRRHLHRGAFIYPLSSCASPEEKAVSTACSTVLGLIPGTEKPGKETHLESPSFLKLDIRKAPTFR